MRYVLARAKERRRDYAYRIYISDSLFYQSQQKRLDIRWEDMIKPRKVEHRTGEQIVADVIKSAGLKVIDDESI